MAFLFRWLRAGIAVLALWVAGPAAAQENLDQGKTAAQLYASDCEICHKSPQTFVKGLSFRGLEGFLRQHYTASRESAAAISTYLRGIDKGAPKNASKGGAASKRKSNAAKAALPPHRPSDTKTSGEKSSEQGDAKANAAEGQSQAKPAEPKAPPNSSGGPK